MYDGKLFVVDRFIQHFEDGLGDWRLEGDAVTIHGWHERYTGQGPIHRNGGWWGHLMLDHIILFRPQQE